MVAVQYAPFNPSDMYCTPSSRLKEVQVARAMRARPPPAPQPPTCLRKMQEAIIVGWKEGHGTWVSDCVWELQVSEVGTARFKAIYDGSNTNTLIQGLLPGQAVDFRVRARNRYGASDWSEISTLQSRSASLSARAFSCLQGAFSRAEQQASAWDRSVSVTTMTSLSWLAWAAVIVAAATTVLIAMSTLGNYR